MTTDLIPGERCKGFGQGNAGSLQDRRRPTEGKNHQVRGRGVLMKELKNPG